MTRGSLELLKKIASFEFSTYS